MKNIETVLIHGGEESQHHAGAVVPPIFTSSTYETTSDGPIHYPRLSNTPAHTILHEKIRSLEGAEASLVASSGMSAISATLLTLLDRPSHFIAQRNIYGTAHHFFTTQLRQMGHEVEFTDLRSAKDLEALIRPNTRVIYLESLSNPLLEIPDFENIIPVAKRKKIWTVMDSTFTPPTIFRPLDLGIDVNLHSATKYLNGHSDVLAGAISGSRSVVHSIRDTLKNLGGSLDGFSAYLLNRGLKTLPLRMEAIQKNTLRIAKGLEALPKIQRVFYPGLESHPQSERARKYFRGFGGVIAFETDASLPELPQRLEKLQIIQYAPSLGGVESLITLPWKTSHSFLSEEERARIGIGRNLVRLSVGLEHPDDLLEDLKSALS